MPYATQSKGLWKGGKPPDYHTDIDLKGQGRLAQEEKKKKKTLAQVFSCSANLPQSTTSGL